MISKKISRNEFLAIGKQLQEEGTDFFGGNKLSTICDASGSYSIVTFESAKGRDDFINSWHETVTVCQRDRGNRRKVEKLKV